MGEAFSQTFHQTLNGVFVQASNQLLFEFFSLTCNQILGDLQSGISQENRWRLQPDIWPENGWYLIYSLISLGNRWRPQSGMSSDTGYRFDQAYNQALDECAVRYFIGHLVAFLSVTASSTRRRFSKSGTSSNIGWRLELGISTDTDIFDQTSHQALGDVFSQTSHHALADVSMIWSDIAPLVRHLLKHLMIYIF